MLLLFFYTTLLTAKALGDNLRTIRTGLGRSLFAIISSLAVHSNTPSIRGTRVYLFIKTNLGHMPRVTFTFIWRT